MFVTGCDCKFFVGFDDNPPLHFLLGFSSVFQRIIVWSTKIIWILQHVIWPILFMSCIVVIDLHMLCKLCCCSRSFIWAMIVVVFKVEPKFIYIIFFFIIILIFNWSLDVTGWISCLCSGLSVIALHCSVVESHITIILVQISFLMWNIW